jgi:hypothetical protein
MENPCYQSLEIIQISLENILYKKSINSNYTFYKLKIKKITKIFINNNIRMIKKI